MEYIYRFRPVSRLLNEDAVSGELDSQYIFFAEPQSLNDPLEGFKYVYFSGDKIIWRNLLRHYVRCLINDFSISMISRPDEEPSRLIGVFANAQDSPPAINEINDEVMNELDKEPVIKKYFDILGNGRKISRPELIGHLNLIHFSALTAILTTFKNKGLFAGDLNFYAHAARDQISKIKLVLNEVSEAGEFSKELERVLINTYRLITELQLRNRYKLDASDQHESWNHLLFEYPESFAKSLDSLIYPEWYVACFMESCSDSSIWGTYGGNHRDVCLKFKVDPGESRPTLELNYPAGLNNAGIMHNYIKIPLDKISYDKNFVEVDFFRSLGQLSMPQIDEWYRSEEGGFSICAQEMRSDVEAWRKAYWNNFVESSKIKIKAWDREQEWRIILHSTINDFDDPNTRKIKYRFNSLDGIIFGINTVMADKIKIIRRIEALCKEHKREVFNFYQAAFDDNSKTIKHDLLSYIDVGYRDSTHSL